jgi:hypothetical protein
VSREVCFTGTDVALRFQNHFAPPMLVCTTGSSAVSVMFWVNITLLVPALVMQATRLAVSLALQFAAFAGALNRPRPRAWCWTARRGASMLAGAKAGTQWPS